MSEQEWRLVPVEASDELLRSMAVRYDHGLGCDGYYDQPMFAQDGITHAMRLRGTLTTMRQLHEEVVGTGFAAAPPMPRPLFDAMVERMAQRMFERDRAWFGNVEGAMDEAADNLRAALPTLVVEGE